MRCWVYASTCYCRFLLLMERWEDWCCTFWYTGLTKCVLFQLQRTVHISSMWRRRTSTFVWSRSSRGVVFSLMELVVRNDVIREDVRGLLRERSSRDLPLETVAQCKFSEQFGSYFPVWSKEVGTAKKAIRAVSREIGKTMSGPMEQYLSMAPLDPILICQRNWDSLPDSFINLDSALSMRGCCLLASWKNWALST